MRLRRVVVGDEAQFVAVMVGMNVGAVAKCASGSVMSDSAVEGRLVDIREEMSVMVGARGQSCWGMSCRSTQARMLMCVGDQHCGRVVLGGWSPCVGEGDV